MIISCSLFAKEYSNNNNTTNSLTKSSFIEASLLSSQDRQSQYSQNLREEFILIYEIMKFSELVNKTDYAFTGGQG
jgi:hypothetical protein